MVVVKGGEVWCGVAVVVLGACQWAGMGWWACMVLS